MGLIPFVQSYRSLEISFVAVDSIRPVRDYHDWRFPVLIEIYGIALI